MRVVDSDVHPVPRAGVLAGYVPEPYRSKYLNHQVGDTINYDACRYTLRPSRTPPHVAITVSSTVVSYRTTVKVGQARAEGLDNPIR